MKIKVGELYDMMFVREPFQVKVTNIFKLEDVFYVEYYDVSNGAKSVESAEYFKSCIERASRYKESEHFEEIEI